MSLKMQEKMSNLKKKWLNEGFQKPFEIRYKYRFLQCKNFNREDDHTIIGGEVNIAATLKQLEMQEKY